jgi:peptidoglycan/LPS O-acetylase OafA/YrhL
VYHLVDTHAGAAFGGANLLALAGYNAAALLAAGLLYLAVERPGLRLRARLMGEGRRAHAASLPSLTP